MIRTNSIVRMTEKAKKWYKENYPESRILHHERFIFLGEIPNMIGHCIVVTISESHILNGLHTYDFEEIPEDEV